MRRSASGIQIMLVDDHPVVRRGVREILAEAFPDAEIREIGSGIEAMTLTNHAHWDVIILDLRTALDAVATPYVIPGARRVTTDALDTRVSDIPLDRDLVVYCS